MLSADLSDHHLVIALAAVLQQDLEHLPQAAKHAVLVFGMLHCFLNHFIKADAIDKEGPIQSVDVFDWDARVM